VGADCSLDAVFWMNLIPWIEARSGFHLHPLRVPLPAVNRPDLR
jgi:hypothetical protein